MSGGSLRLGVAAVLAVAACGDPLPLSTTQQDITVSPGSWDFGSSDVGVEVGPHSFVVSYGIGFGQDTVLAITSCPDFRVELGAASLPYDVYRFCETGQAICQFYDIQTLVFDVYFRPSIANVEGCNLVIDMQTSVDKVVSLQGTGTAPPIDITLIQPATPSLDFGDVLVGQTSAPRTVTVRSDGGSQLDITAAGTSGAGFASSGPATVSLQPSQTQDYSVTCTPTGPGEITGAFTITSNDPDEGNLSVALRCNGIQSALQIGPSPATLPITRVGESSEVTITLTNTGSAALMIESVAVTGDGMTIVEQPGMLALPATGGATTMRVGFSPTADGDVAGLLTVTYDGGQTRQVALTGPGRVAVLSVTPSGDIDFGPICVGQADDRLFVALDTGTGGFVVETVALAGAGFTLTPIAPATYPAPVSPLGGSTVTFQVGAAPTAAGDANATVSIATDIPNLPTKQIGLHALGLAGGTTTTPTELDAGSAVVGESGGARLVTLSNCEADVLSIVSVEFLGENPADFGIVTAPVTNDVQPATSAAWLVELRPTSLGPKTATFHIVHSRGTADVVLTGDGLDPSGHAGGDPRGSYYACGTTRDGGGAGGAIVIAFAVVVAVGGRRRRPPATA